MRSIDSAARRRHNGDMPIARMLDRSIVNSIRRDAQGRDEFVVHVCDVWLSGQAADGTSVEYATEILQELADNASSVVTSKHSMDIAAKLVTNARVWLAIERAHSLAHDESAHVALARLVQIVRDAQTSWLAENLSSEETKPNRRPAPTNGSQCRAIALNTVEGHSATVTITVDGTTGGVVTLIWDAATTRWELPGPNGWASAGLLQLPPTDLAMCAAKAVEFANWR